ncbi:MAG: hypothetical protein ACOCVZ_02990 [Gemmatimonadota bacterium]
MKRVGLALALALALTGGADPVAGQGTADARLERIRAALPGPAVQEIEARLQSAIEHELPVDPLLDKAVEGIAKGVPAARISAAVEQLTQQLGRARALLGNGAPPAAVDVTAVADALRRGVPESAVRRLAQRARPGEPLALAVHTVGDLMDRGVPGEQAMEVVEAWRGRGGGPDELRQLPAAVERLIRMGVLPEHAAAAVTGEGRGGPPGHPGNQPGAGGKGIGPPDGPPIPPGAGPPADRGKDKGKPPGGGPPPGGG